ncbi:hypothetical protein [Salipiger mucosus]|uniref:Type I secretion target repeat protein n=1 Tax=Salipiger mucosus DSM 16094 TaxID=1123237 RepID=S9QRY9_9RHOB|nr:hypothetical protein [Salipiger mucosus]EPX82428.1 hypothetical protein Salmuc_03233 [Salipiger mucosus DSM 16094]
MFERWIGAALVALSVTGAARAQEGREDLSLYVFGNSLVHHLGEEAHSNVPYWMAQLAEADGRDLALDGQWGFLRNFAEDLPPKPNWSFEAVQSLWSPGRGSFGDAGYDAIVVTPANFTQYQAPDAPYDGENPDEQSPLGAVLRIVDWLESRTPGAPVWIYQGWAEMEPHIWSFPPNARRLRRYQAANLGDYDDWYRALAEGVAEARDGKRPGVIPVARVLARLLGEDGPLEELPAEALYVDADPHGTPTLYFLAAMVTYATLYDRAPPEGFLPPDTLHPRVVADYPELAGFVREQVQAAREAGDAPAWPVDEAQAAPDAEPETRSAEAEAEPAPLPRRGRVALPGPGARPEGAPALAMGLNGLSDWSTQHPFIDKMKSAREWVGHLPGQWGGVGADEMRAAGLLDADGWPQRLPEGVERIEALILTDQPEDAQHLRGDYRVFWEGEGKLELIGRARRARYGEGWARFHYTPGEGLVGIAISELDPEDPIRDIHVVQERHLALWEAGALFDPHWIARVRDLRAVRFMDWMKTNSTAVTDWDTRPRMSDYTWTAWGVPLPVMIRLANEIGADPWFNMPHAADDDYVRSFAGAVRDGLDPRLKAYVEYSNEVWNHIFPQADWAGAQAEARWGRSETGWMQFYGLRAAQIMDIWTEVFGEAADERLVRVAAMHTGWPGLEEQVLTAPLAFLELGRPPRESFDAYAVTGYFGYELGGAEMEAEVQGWLDRAEAQAIEAGEAQGLQRVALREFVRDRRFEAAIPAAAMALQEGSLAELTDELFPYHAEAAEDAGLRLVMYEGGTHVVGHGTRLEDERLTAFFETLNYSPEMAKLYESLLTGWVAAGGTLFNAFVDVSGATKWGSWGALRHLDDANPRWDMLMAYNASAPTDWDPRPEGTFAEGEIVEGTRRGDRLEGTPEEDVLLGGPGDDVLSGAGGADRLHGGAGTDTAILPGTREGYSFARRDGRLIATREGIEVWLTEIERIAFEDGSEAAIETAGL